jgi:hypothetical protein
MESSTLMQIAAKGSGEVEYSVNAAEAGRVAEALPVDYVLHDSSAPGFGEVASALEVVGNAVSAFQPPPNIFSLQAGNWAPRASGGVSDISSFAGRRFLTLRVLPDRAVGIGDSDSLFFPSWTLIWASVAPSSRPRRKDTCLTLIGISLPHQNSLLPR